MLIPLLPAPPREGGVKNLSKLDLHQLIIKSYDLKYNNLPPFPSGESRTISGGDRGYY